MKASRGRQINCLMTGMKNMHKGNLRLGMVAILIIIGAVAICTIGSTAVQEPRGPSQEARADLITIDTLKTFGDIERPAVIFLHDLHTEALAKQDKDCKSCHLEVKTPPSLAKKNALSVKFKRLKDTSRKQVLNVYHTECIGCHKKSVKSGQKAGPVERCGKCHLEPDGAHVVSDRHPIKMDKSLHYRHIEATKDKAKDKTQCGLCHHKYDEAKEKLYYAEGKEGSCLYCHGDRTEKNRMSIQLASHYSCVDCHRRRQAKDPTLAEKNEIGPIKCAGCHDLQEQRKIKVIKDVPRIKRKQPDFALIQPKEKELSEKEKQDLVLMDPVPFDHKAHEANNETCRVCHHASLESCSEKCHSLNGQKDGDFIKLAQAMHQPQSKRSCLGCHNDRQQERACAGCHTFIKKGAGPDISACETCHMKSEGMATAEMKPEDIAREMLKARNPVRETFKDDDIPEKVVIKTLSDQYEGAEFPHRKIVKTLVKKTKDNKLATYYHREKGTLCQGCHHRSPPAKKPPRCSRCHGRPFDQNSLSRPGLKGAYHIQCLGCHKAMNLEKPKPRDCKVCHKEKKK